MPGNDEQSNGRPGLGYVAMWAACLLSACAAPVANHVADERPPLHAAANLDERPNNTRHALVPTELPAPEPRATPEVDKAAIVNVTPEAPDQELDDLWSRMRRGFNLPAMQHARVDSFVKRFRDSRYFHLKADRIRLLMPLVVAEVERQELPMELALIPLVESALNCQATSSAAAHGCWQFMPLTAKDHDLVISALVDQRRDVLRSTLAGLGYLSSLERQTGDWFLAMSAYNWGVGRVLRLKARAQARGAATDFVSLMPGMPTETQNYAPQVEALKRIIVEALPEDLPDASAVPALQPVKLHRDIDVALAARLAGITEADLLTMNPAIQRPVILAVAVPELLLSDGAAARFTSGLRLHTGPTSSWKLVRVDGHHTVANIANARGISADLIRQVNHIPKGMKPTSGSTLLLPAGMGGAEERVSQDQVESAHRQLVPEVVRVWLKASRNDTLATIAARLSLPAKQLAAWNPKLAKIRRLRTGQRVLLLVAPELSERLAAQGRPAVR